MVTNLGRNFTSVGTTYKLKTNKMPTVLDKKTMLKKAEDLSKTTHFSRQEIESLLKVYKELTEKSATGKIDRNKFRDFIKSLGITDDMMMDRVFKAFDADNDSYISVDEWVKGLSVFLRGTLDEQMKFCFDVYDMRGEGFLSRDNMFHMLKTSMVKPTSDEDPEEGIKDLVELCIKLLDNNHDQRVTYDDFCASVKEEGLLLEALGQCLPTQEKSDAFQETLCSH